MPAADDICQVPRRLYLLPLAGWLVLVVVGYLPTRSLGGAGALEAMVAGQAVVVAVVYGTLVPALRRMATAEARVRLRIALKAGGVRFLLTVLIGAVVAWRGFVEPSVFLIWLAIAYVVMIKIEVWTLIRWGKRLESQT
ncbi:MAG: hypothetical protein JXQ75_14785 [Phycisphaerae bacterium]|nr:hypothetical protein [Phycisphaerae bacterium]